MKKIFAMALAVAMMLTLLVACGDKTPETQTPDVQVPASAEEILTNVWAQYPEDMWFPTVIGDPAALVEEPTYTWDMTNTENMPYVLLIPQDQIANVDDVASAMHSMNANTYTCGVFHMAPGADAADFAETMRNAVQGNQWMCGFPEQLIIANIAGEYVMVAFGRNDAMNPFQTYFSAAYPEAQIVVNEPIA